ncbi:glycosyltransferase [Actinomycetospora corticicola]|uniref:Glycosyltransferase involved in cell wall biosynthesis n=1 Tax=Actinomycetospora corticicola TaxID=663602 RepID=A0A7Y9DSA9_9PSEU|nr:glycosyltransferase involved in cell wall biosynthesis [Actinomycetospora corticicola]
MHVRNFYFPSRYPYAPFLDTTLRQREKWWPEPELKPRHYRTLQALEKIYFRRATLVFVAGAYLTEEVVRFYGVPRERVVSVGAGPASPVASLAAPETSAQRDPLRVLFVGKEFERKGGHLLVGAVSHLRDLGCSIELHMVGCEVPELMKADFIVEHGHISDVEQLSILYSASDIFCLPALFEPYGLVILEAMAHGLPLVTSDFGALPALVRENDAGIVVKAGSVDDLTAALYQLAKNPPERERQAENSRRAASNYTWDLVADEMVNAIDTLSKFNVSTGPKI